MRSLGALPKPVLILEVFGIALLLLSYLSLNGYVSLPAPIGTATAAIVMVFSGIALMIPAAACMVWAMAQNVAPLLTRGAAPKSQSDKTEDKRDDADH
ncbi:YbjC family protein [Enterobacteriaceae bacterium H11S18]|nr:MULTISPECIES: YbjC family protein [Enterobacteriaceae]MCT4710901.1 YbjC family protein [Dryocola clanedunensis]